MNRLNIFRRLSAIVPMLCGVVIGWLVAALLFAVSRNPAPFLALCLIWATMAWELRWWTELKWRLPIAIFGGGFLLNLLRPVVSYRYTAEDWIPHPLADIGPFCSVNWCIIGACFFAFIILAIAPMTYSGTQTSDQAGRVAG